MQSRFVSHYIANPARSGTQSAIAAGSTNPAIMASTWLADLNVRKTIASALEAAGITPEYAARNLKIGIEARKTGLTKAGNVVDMGPDGLVSSRHLELVLKATGALDQRIDLNVSGAIVHFAPGEQITGDMYGAAIDVTPDAVPNATYITAGQGADEAAKE